MKHREVSAPVRKPRERLSRYNDYPTSRRLAKAFGERVRKLREERGLIQKELDAKLIKGDNGGSYTSQIESGKRVPGIITMYKYAVAFGITLSELLEGIE